MTAVYLVFCRLLELVVLLGRREGQSWRRFLQAHGESILTCDFFTVDTIWLRHIYVLAFPSIGSRRIEYIACTRKRFLIHDRDAKFPTAFDALLATGRSAGVDRRRLRRRRGTGGGAKASTASTSGGARSVRGAEAPGGPPLAR